jgi:two-component system, OmpR family, sensor histidine kinase KdpD
MSELPPRPDPDALLRRVSDAENKARRGKLKIFFGFAPGVGKTYRMLQVARDLVCDQKLDIVVGLVETHRRMDTAALLLGMDILPKRKVEYRGRTLEEFDLDAALARRPQLLLVDELAHTNAPGSRHTKRWQDILEVLDTGIDVYTTVNVQHLESLNDVIAQITHVIVHETIPDSIVERADEVELVDIAPEELLTRLREGKVYLPDQAQRAADHFFQRGNLLALRELALRRIAQRVDAEVQQYREDYGVDATWPASERILVCVGPAPSSARLVRTAARMAAGLRATWVAAYVHNASLGAMSEPDRERLESHLRLAESLGGSVARLDGTRVSEALLSYARKNHVTRIVLGKPTHPRLKDLLRGSLLNEVVRGSGEIDVHVISGTTQETPHRSSAPTFARIASPRDYAWSLLIVAVTTLLAISLRAIFHIPDLEMLYLLAVVAAAMRLSRGPSILAAALSVCAYDFFFVVPYYTFAVADVRYLLTFMMMFVVGLLLSELTTRLRRQEQDARQREERTKLLYAFTRDLGVAEDRQAAAQVVARHVASAFGTQAHVLLGNHAGQLEVAASYPSGGPLESKGQVVSQWVFEHGRIAGMGTDTLPGSDTLCFPLLVRGAPLGAIAIKPPTETPLRIEQRDYLEALGRQAAFAFERMTLAEDARNAALRAKTEEMRSSLLSAVSHDLRTPLATITGSATVLRDNPALVDDQTRRDLLDSICEQAERLEKLVANLLDMTRLESGAIGLNRDWVPLDEIVGSALTRLEKELGARPVQVQLPDPIALVSVDPVLFEQVFVNLFENALKYTPSGSPITVRATTDEHYVVVEVLDTGPGIPPGSETRIFEKFFRHSRVGVSGAGLGLAICKGIVEAHGGTLRAENRPEGGALFRMTLPAVENMPPMALESVEVRA